MTARTKTRVRDYTKAEWDALKEKMDNPDYEVICPRCENKIIYEERGNSINVGFKKRKKQSTLQAFTRTV